jgi:zinc protease
MFFKANKDYPDQEKFIKRTQELGMIWNGTTGDERVNYFFTFDRDSLEAGLNFMNAAIRYPIYRVEDMQKERPVVDGEFQRGESDPGFQLWIDVAKRTWGENFTRKNPIGDHDVINTASPEKMMIIKDKYYFPNNSILQRRSSAPGCRVISIHTKNIPYRNSHLSKRIITISLSHPSPKLHT